jgi:hypothetical protein
MSLKNGEARLCIGMLKAAVKDMRRPGLSHAKVSGCAWLASSAATPWFDYVRIEQRYALERIGWVVHAAQILEKAKRETLKGRHKKPKPLPASHLRVIAEGLEKLTRTER